MSEQEYHEEQQELTELSDDVLTSVANATFVLLDGPDLQRLAVLYQFPQFLEHCPNDTLQIMVPQICKDAMHWKKDVQMAAAEALYYVVKMLVPESVAKKVCIASLRIIQMSESGDVFDAWGEILSMMLPQVKRNDVLTLVVPATKDKAKSNLVESRRLAARIIGSLCDTLTAAEIEEQFLEQAVSLCEDSDPSVITMIVQSLVEVGQKLPLKTTETYFWPRLEKMIQEKNSRVKAAAMRAIARTIEAHKDETPKSQLYKTTMLPLFLSECEKATSVASQDLRTVDDDTYLMLEIFSEVFGFFLVSVAELITDDETWMVVLTTVRRMVMCNGPTVRHWCAFNMPAIAVVCGTSRPDKIKGVIAALSTDTDIETRATLATGFHELANILGDGILREEIIGAFGELLTDRNSQVRVASLDHFSDTIHLLSRNQDDLGKKHLSLIYASLEAVSQDSWRTQEKLAQQIDKACPDIPPDFLCQNVAPLLFQMARESTYLVRKSSMNALVKVMRYVPDVRRRDHIMKHFRKEWAEGKVYWTRLAFLDGAACATDIFSHSLYRHLFCPQVLMLYNDDVTNVRLRLAHLLADIFPIVQDYPEFQECLKALKNDPDKEVQQAVAYLEEVRGSWTGLHDEAKTEEAKREANEAAFYIKKSAKKKDAHPDRGAKIDDKDDDEIEDRGDKERDVLKIPEGGRSIPKSGRTISFSNGNANVMNKPQPPNLTHTVLNPENQWAQAAYRNEVESKRSEESTQQDQPPKENVQTPPPAAENKAPAPPVQQESGGGGGCFLFACFGK